MEEEAWSRLTSLLSWLRAGQKTAYLARRQQSPYTEPFRCPLSARKQRVIQLQRSFLFWTAPTLKAQAAMSKNGIYFIGLAILGAVMGYFPDVFRDPVRFLAGVIYLVLLRIAACKLGK